MFLLSQTGIVIVLQGMLSNASHISFAFRLGSFAGKEDTSISTCCVVLAESVRMRRPVI